MTITEARSIVKDFVSQWSDFKIASVLAFAEDGKMEYVEPCNCLLGVHCSDVLHAWEQGPNGNETCPDWDEHMRRFSVAREVDRKAELAYLRLGFIDKDDSEYGGDDSDPSEQKRRDREFIAILNSVIAERDAQRANADEAQPVEIAQESAR